MTNFSSSFNTFNTHAHNTTDLDAHKYTEKHTNTQTYTHTHTHTQSVSTLLVKHFFAKCINAIDSPPSQRLDHRNFISCTQMHMHLQISM